MANDHNDCAEGRGITFAPDNRFDTSVMPRFDQVGLGASGGTVGPVFVQDGHVDCHAAGLARSALMCIESKARV